MDLQIHNFPKNLHGSKEQWKALSLKIIQTMGLGPKLLNIIFTDDLTLQKMHQRYLNDPEKTDVITFDLGDENGIEGEIYISFDRASQQAKEYGVTLEEEVLRLIVHGLLHLKGYDDLEEEARKIMKAQENLFVERFRREFIES